MRAARCDLLVPAALVAFALLAGSTQSMAKGGRDSTTIRPPGPPDRLLGQTVYQCQGKPVRLEAHIGQRPASWTVVPSGARAIPKAQLVSKPNAIRLSRTRELIDPVLLDRIDKDISAPETVLVTFVERVTIPPFPSLIDSLPRAHELNQLRLRRAQALIASIQRQRDSLYKGAEKALAGVHGARIFEKFWLAPTYAVIAPRSQIRAISQLRGVTGVEASVGNEPPPSCPPLTAFASDNYPDDDVAAGLQQMETSTFGMPSLMAGTVSLLDTGVWRNHVLLAEANLGLLGDCVHGGPNCNDVSATGFSGADQCKNEFGHGTAAAAILVGTNALGDAWRGGLQGGLDSYQVFAPGACGDCHLCLSRLALERALHAAVASLSRVVIANCIANEPSDVFGVCVAADNAFLAGTVVVAANGNKGKGFVGAPAIDPKVIGVGSRVLGSTARIEAAQGFGPVDGNRTKPDIQAPSGSETAEYNSNCPTLNNLVTSLNGTSGAAPFAGVAASLLRDWMKAADPDLAPGHVYAALILSGRNFGTAVNDSEGVGIVVLPSNCCTWFGAEDVPEATTKEIPVDLTGSSATQFEAALWWPESQTIGEPDDTPLRHCDLDLRIVDPTGTVVATSEQTWSVFERATAPINGKHGIWKIQIIGGDYWAAGRDGGFPSPDVIEPGHLQRVYWAADARGTP